MHIQIKVPNQPFSVGVLNLSGMKNWDIEDFRMCTKVSQTLNLKFKIFTTFTKYTSLPLPSAAVARGGKIGAEG